MKKYIKEHFSELFRYGIVGVATTIVSLGIYYGLIFFLLDPQKALELQIANVCSWIGAVLFAFWANRKYVFGGTERGVIRDMSAFFASRLMSLGLDMFIMFVGVTVLLGNDSYIKIISQIVITVVNYLFSKLYVFRKKGIQGNEKGD